MVEGRSLGSRRMGRRRGARRSISHSSRTLDQPLVLRRALRLNHYWQGDPSAVMEIVVVLAAIPAAVITTGTWHPYGTPSGTVKYTLSTPADCDCRPAYS